MTKPYKDALAEAREVGAAHATGDAELAQTCFALSKVHAVPVEMLYRAAADQGLSGLDLVRLAERDLTAFSFLPFDAPV